MVQRLLKKAAARNLLFCVITCSGTAVALARQPAGDTLIFPNEKHFANIKQLTFGGINAEAYFSFDEKQIIFMSTRDSLKCEQIFTMDVDGQNVKMVSTGKGITTCPYFSIRMENTSCIHLLTSLEMNAHHDRTNRRAMFGVSTGRMIFSWRTATAVTSSA